MSAEPPDGQPAPRRHLAAGAAFSLAAQVGPIGALAILSVVIARLLGPSGNGRFSLLTSLLEITALVSAIGLTAGITYHVSHGAWSARKAAADSRRVALALGLVGAGLALAFFLATRSSLFAGVPAGLGLVVVAAVPCRLVWEFAGGIALGRERYEAFAAFQVVQSAVLLAVGTALAFPLGLTGVVVGLLAGQAAAAAFATWWLTRYGRSPVDRAARDRPGVDAGGELPGAVRFGLKSWGANLLQLLNYRMDLFILSAVASSADVGVYAVALSVTSLGWLLPSALETVLFPRTASLDAAVRSGEIEAERSDAPIVSAVRHTVLLLVPTAAILGAVLALVPLLYGADFRRTVGLGLILLPGVVGLGLAKVLSAVFTGRGYPQYALRSALVAAPLTIVLYLALIPPLHATGAALASTASYLLTTVLALLYFRRATGIRLRTALVPRGSDLADYAEAWRRLRALAALRAADGRARRPRARPPRPGG